MVMRPNFVQKLANFHGLNSRFNNAWDVCLSDVTLTVSSSDDVSSWFPIPLHATQSGLYDAQLPTGCQLSANLLPKC